jgi:hypothetical protein
MRMTWIAAFTLPFLFAAAPQERGQEPPQEPDWLTKPELRAEYFREQLVGAWQLKSAKRGSEAFLGGRAAGYALFTEGFMSLELHVASSQNTAFDGTFFQTGIHRWQIDSNARLETFSLIGTSSFTPDDIARFEPHGTRRQYELTLNANELVLRRTDGSSELSFMRLKNLAFPSEKGDAVDFYGRPKKQ